MFEIDTTQSRFFTLKEIACLVKIGKILSDKQTDKLKEYQGACPVIISSIESRGNSRNKRNTELLKWYYDENRTFPI